MTQIVTQNPRRQEGVPGVDYIPPHVALGGFQSEVSQAFTSITTIIISATKTSDILTDRETARVELPVFYHSEHGDGIEDSTSYPKLLCEGSGQR